MNSTDNKLIPPPSLDARLIAALEHKPEPPIPADFAAKIAARAAAQPPRRRRMVPQFGSAIALFSAPVAAMALFALAPHTVANIHSLSFDTELVILAELAFIACWVNRTFTSRLFG